MRRFATNTVIVGLAMCARVATQTPHHQSHHDAAPALAIVPNDNRQPAGSLIDGILTLELRAQFGVLRPEGDAGRALRVAAFSERSLPPSAPAPLIRVPAGTTIAADVRNDLDRPLTVHGLCDRREKTCLPFDVPAGQTRHVRFNSGPAGTYHYWGTAGGAPLAYRGADVAQLSGAFIVDSADAARDADRVLVITEWTSVTLDQLKFITAQDDPGAAFLKLRPDFLFLINGRSWPDTERLTYGVGERVRWRVVNLSTQLHPMHLHGFHYQVESLGDGIREQPDAGGQKPSVVTQLMPPGATMAMTWIPERVGNWLFHCHVMTHVSPDLYVDGSPKPQAEHDAHHAGGGMTGMVLGITVTPRDGAVPREAAIAPATPARKMTLMIHSEPHRIGDLPALGFQLTGTHDSSRSSARVSVPGPSLVLKRGEPVEITLVNRLTEATAIHWHGMELDSYYDGVHGFSGTDQHVTPMIEPGASFVVRFTPPRAGTFIYHTHLHDRRQLTSGLYGALLVIEPEDIFDDATDHVLIIGRDGPALEAAAVINGQRAPRMVWKGGLSHRVRVINITPDDILSVALQAGGSALTWRPVAKDGASLPPERRGPVAAQLLIGVGETYDFEIRVPPATRSLWVEVRSPGGKWEAQGRVIVR